MTGHWQGGHPAHNRQRRRPWPHWLTYPIVAAVCAAGGWLAADQLDDAPTAAVTPVAAPSPTPSTEKTKLAPADRGRKIGATVVGSGFKVRVREFRPLVDSVPPEPPEEVWAAVRVRMCATEEPLALSWAPWSLDGKDGGRYPAFQSGTYGDWLTPTYPILEEDGVIEVGDCLAGWIHFPMPEGVDVVRVRYSPLDRPPVVWKV